MKTKTFMAALGAMWLGATLVQAQVTVTSVITNGLAEPYNIVTDDNNNFVISDSVNNRIVWVNAATGVGSTLAGILEDYPGSDDGPPYLAHFFNPQGLALATVGGDDGVIVSDTGNHTLRFVRLLDGYVSTLSGVAGLPGNVNGSLGSALLNNPLGLAFDGTNTLYIADSGNNSIRILNLASGDLSTLVVSGTTFNMPTAVALGAPGKLWVADTRNHQVKLFNLTSATTASLVSMLGSGVGGSRDSTFGFAAQLNGPRGLLWRSERSQLLISDTGNHTIRVATNNLTYGATNYAVATFAGTAGINGFTNGLALQSRFDTPVGLALDHEVNGFLIADLKNNAIRRIQDGPALPAVASPEIGWVNFIWNEILGTYVTFLETAQPKIFNNDAQFAIRVEDNTQCHYTTTNTAWPPGFSDDGPNPSKLFGSTPPEYHNGVPKYIFDQNPAVIQIEQNANLGGLVIKAMGYMIGRPSSAVVKANYAFIVADPVIIGNNFASFKVTCVTTNPAPVLYYTVDGTEPTTGSAVVPSGGQITTLTFPPNQTNNITFKVRAVAPNYLPSQTISRVFSATNFVPSRICLGFPEGEVSSRFVASAGQKFYSPVTLQLVSGISMYGLQFNFTATNVTGPKIAGQLDFTSMLYEAVAKEKGEKLPPGQGQWYRNIPPAMWSPTPTNRIFYRPTDFPPVPLMDLRFYNSSLGLIGVGWWEVWGYIDLYDTTKQDVISYSIARDTLFTKLGGRVVLGACAFELSPDAAAGDLYHVKLGRPSATSDGVGAPGSSVFIAAPSTGYLTNGGFYAERDVVVGQERYIVGDVAPFRWLNAGDFGDNYLLNDDVMQVFGCAVFNKSPVDPVTGYPTDPPFYSDLRDSMDAGCVFGVATANGYYIPDPDTSIPSGGPDDVGAQVVLFDGDDTLINGLAFGDRELNATDVYITFRRSLDPSLTWWRRFYTNGVRVAELATNGFPSGSTPASFSRPAARPATLASFTTNPPALQFIAGDAQVNTGQTIQIPITARVHGDFPLRVLMLSLSVEALEGAPPISDPIQFAPVGALGSPTLGTATGPNSYAAAWLNNGIPGLIGDALLGTLTIKIPSGALPGAAYAIHFVHASGSPNGLGTFPQRVQTGLLTLSDRSASSLGDGIPDAWRLRYFGSANTVLAAATADADGDGHSNRQEFLAGTDPNDSQSVLKLLSKTAGTGATKAFVVRWPSVAAKHYVIERSISPFGPNWLPAGTATGTGWDMEFTDPDTSPSARFYRVRVAE